MELDGENGFSIKLNTVKTILLKLYENKPTFPIESIDVLTEALGGKDQEYYINEKLGNLSANVLAEKSFKNVDNISEPNQVVDTLLGDSFINIITKAKLLEKLQSLQFPVESKDQFASHVKDLIIYGIPIGKLAEKLDYPIDKPEQILNRIKLLDHCLYDANVDLIYDITEGEIGGKEDKPEPSAEEVQELPLKERIKRIIEMGKNAYREKNYEMAIQIYDEGLELDPDNTEIRFLNKAVVAKIEDMKKKEGGAFPVEEVESTLESKPKTEIEPEPASDVEPVTKPEQEPEPEPGPEPEPTPPKEVTGHDEFPLEPSGDELPIESAKTDIEPETKAEVEVEVKSEVTDSESAPEGTILGDSDEKLSDFSEEKAKIGETAGELGAAANNIEKLEKKLEEKFKALRDLAQPFKELPEDACKSCEGTGECYWCKGSGKCETCSGTGKTETGEDCKKCSGSGTCQSCNSSGKCHWCSGSGKKK